MTLTATPARAENVVQWKTNHYYVTGTTVHALRQSINHARPGGKSGRTDGLTTWNVTWNYRLAPGGLGCRVTSFSTKTTITMTLPAWNAPRDADESLKKNWARYYSALLRHEVGHAQIAQSAEAAVRSRAGGLSSAENCSGLRRLVETTAQSVLREFRVKDQEFDRRTNHGLKDGAHFP